MKRFILFLFLLFLSQTLLTQEPLSLTPKEQVWLKKNAPIKLDKERLRQKADKLNINYFGDVYEVIFEDGFSSRDDVTEFSGRGVGLSAVKAEIEKLGGKIEIESEIGKGTTFRFVVPA